VLGLLTNVDRAALAAYCDSYGLWVEADEEIKKIRKQNREFDRLRKKYPDQKAPMANGMVRETMQGNVIIEPMLSVRNRALEQMHKFLVEFGMTPASRCRITADKPKHKEIDPMEEVLSRGRQN